MSRWFVLSLCLLATTCAEGACGSRLFVSGWFSTVHVFDACTGAYVRDLDTRSRLAGAMAVRLGPDGFIYAVSEQGGGVHKYRNDTLEYAGTFVQAPGIGATGLAFDAQGMAWLAGFQTDEVRKYDRAGASLGTPVPAHAANLNGPDSGMTFGPDGNLYIPSWNNHSVVRFDPRTGQASIAVANGTAGLRHTRGLLPSRDREHIFITSEGSGTVLKWNLASGAVSVLASGLAVPTGIDYGVDGMLLVSNADGVVRIDPATGAQLGSFVAPGTGGISGQVFLSVLPTADMAQVGTQYWVVGNAAFDGRVLDLTNVLSATGSGFGPGLRFSELAIRRWGSVRLELTACDRANFTWSSSGPDSARFGDGGYPMQRLFTNEATTRCQQQGIDAADKSWVNGNWYGGESHSGEGILLHRRADGTTFLAWFTYHPLGDGADMAQVGSQYWLAGDGPLVGRRLTVPLLSATGTHFGPTMRFSELTLRHWGTITIEFTSCSTASFTWTSSGPDSANFGDGGYPLQRYFDDEASARCAAQGLDAADKSWISGQWWGGDAHAGEGLFLDRRGDGRVFAAWFTHRPR